MKRLVISVMLLCVPTLAQDFTPPEWADPNLIEGEVLPWISGDPNGWECSSGKGIRAGTWEDPDGHLVDVNAVTTGWTVAVTSNGQWTLAGDVVAGANYIVVVATDRPGAEFDGPASATYTVLAWGLPKANRAPILASSFNQGWHARQRWKRRYAMAQYKLGNWLALRRSGIVFINGEPQ